jgi:phage-related protein
MQKVSQKFYTMLILLNKPMIQNYLKKLQSDIWEFRTKYLGNQIRLLAFWYKTDINETLVLATHGFIKKVDKVPANEIERAKAIRKKYFENKPKI